MKLINNEIVDFIFAMNHFANRNKQAESIYPGIPELAEWCSEYEKKLSPFLLNDISLIIEKMVFPSHYLFKLYTTTPSVKTIEEFLTKLDQIKPAEFINQIQRDFLGSRKEELTIDVLRDIFINQGLHPSYDPFEEAELLHGFLKDPENFLKRLHMTYSDFYRIAYKPGRISLKELELSKLQWHENRLAIGAKKYLDQLGLNSFADSLKDNEEPILYYSLFSDTDTSSFWNIRTAIIGAGTDQRIINCSAREKADEFFSCLGDHKRLEILRLTAQRPWYSTELANHFELKPATLSYHLNILVNAKLLHFVKGESRRFYYSLNKKSIKEYLGFVEQDLLGSDYME